MEWSSWWNGVKWNNTKIIFLINLDGEMINSDDGIMMMWSIEWLMSELSLRVSTDRTSVEIFTDISWCTFPSMHHMTNSNAWRLGKCLCNTGRGHKARIENIAVMRWDVCLYLACTLLWSPLRRDMMGKSYAGEMARKSVPEPLALEVELDLGEGLIQA